MEKIEVCNISFSYDEKNVFDNFSASFPAGCTSIIMGASGSGKTTLLKIMAGLLEISHGKVVFPIKNPKFSFIFQDGRMIDSINVEKNIKLINPKVNDKNIVECLEKLGILECKNEKISDLSGGQRQRASIARALLANYDVLFMDEPFKELDDENKAKAMDYIKRNTMGKTVFLVTHDKSEAESFMDNEKNMLYKL